MAIPKYIAESRNRTASDPTVVSSVNRKANLAKHSGVSMQDPDVGQPCLKCGNGCEGFMLHVWRKKCINCGCPKEFHEMEQDPASIPIAIPLRHMSLEILSDGDCEKKHLEKYVWYPPETSFQVVKQYMESLPEELVPLKGSPGEEHRKQQYIRQLPAYDFSPDHCHALTDLEKRRMLKISERRKKTFLGTGRVEFLETGTIKHCIDCGEGIMGNGVYVVAEKASEGKAWHPQCFKCAECRELLVDLIYFYSPENERVYCGRHHAELSYVRCAGCDELIFTPTYTEAQGKKWHKEHFSCSDCDECLQGKEYGTSGEKVLCVKCYGRYADKCSRCRENIEIGSKKIVLAGEFWHEKCFVCKRCREDLREKRYFRAENDLLCEECIQPAIQCYGCKEGISPAVSHLSHKNRNWHPECFKCVSCRTWLIDGQFHDYDDALMCSTCFIDKVSKKCHVCTKPITSKAVQFGINVYHKECFLCTDCGCALEGDVKVKEKEGKPYCNQCVLKFAQKCYKCRGPITSRHTVYRNHPFHFECFKCNKCGSPVAQTTFYETTLYEILCKDCAGQ